MKSSAELEPLRSLGFASISGTYAAVGTPFEFPSRLICFTNATNGDVFFTRDPSRDELFVGAGSFKLFDVATNHRPTNQDDNVFRAGTQWYVKQSTAPTEKSVYIETMYAE
ncbi:MAG TPA: hypothetical protein VKZ95_03690 [Sphingobacteriaceae bacterium]|nr:hypothetical protein [Sphingobacteriaceae bacterium]